MLNEHWKLDNGKFKGLYTIDPKKAKASSFDDGSLNNFAYWDKVEEIIKAYVRIHPEEIAETLKQVEIERINSYTDYGEMVNSQGKTGDHEFRHHAKLPVGLVRVLEITNPEILEDRRYYIKFLRKHPGFSASRKI